MIGGHAPPDDPGVCFGIDQRVSLSRQPVSKDYDVDAAGQWIGVPDYLCDESGGPAQTHG